jgi:hypothetical protein
MTTLSIATLNNMPYRYLNLSLHLIIQPLRRLLVMGCMLCALIGVTPIAAAVGFSPAASFVTARGQHTATLLTNGKLLIVGGYGELGNGLSGGLASAELYDPGTNTWSSAGNMAVGRYSHTATRLLDGQVLVTGGADNITGPLASVELYNPATNTWTTVGSLAGARYYHTATLLANGLVVVAAGLGVTQLSSGELYNPASQTWSATGPMGNARRAHTATLLANGRVLVVGGSQRGLPDAVSAAELYDPSTNTWGGAGGIIGRYFHTATLLANGQVLAMGGTTQNGANSASGDIYSGTWNQATPFSYGRSQHTATLLLDGRVLVTGGFTRFLGTRITEIYDATIPPTWRVAESMANARVNHTATLLANGRVLVVGGSDNTAEFYDAGIAQAPLTVSSTSTALALNGTATLSSSGGSGTGGVDFVSDSSSCFILGNTLTGIARGICTITATKAADATFSAAVSAGITVTVGLQPSSVNVTSSVNPLAAGFSTILTASVTATGPAAGPTGTVNFRTGSSTLSNCGAVALVSGQASCTVTITAQGNYPISADYSGDTNNAPATGALAGGQVVNAPVIVVSPTALPSGTVGVLYSGTVSISGGTAPYTVTSTVVAPPGLNINLSTGVFSGTPTAAGTITFDLLVTDANNFSTTKTYTIVINGAPQTITFGAQAAQSTVIGGTFALNPVASASSGLTVSYTSSTQGVCTISGITVTVIAAGLCTINADQAGSTTVAPATQVSQSITLTPAAISLVAVVSRKTHGTAGTFDLPIDRTVAITGAVTVEPRIIGAGHTIVFQFNSAVTSVGTVNIVNGLGNPFANFTTATSGNEVIVTLTGLPDATRITLSVDGVNGGVSATTSMGFLAGDVNGTRVVNGNDISATNARTGQTTDVTNFRFDINNSGAINGNDISALRARTGSSL